MKNKIQKYLSQVTAVWFCSALFACAPHVPLSDGNAAKAKLNPALSILSGQCDGPTSTVDDFSYDPATSSSARAFGRDADGNLYVAGFGFSAADLHPHGIVRKSVDNGNTWSNIDDFAGENNAGISYSTMAINGQGALWMGTSTVINTSSEILGIRFTPDRGKTWVYGNLYSPMAPVQKMKGAAISPLSVPYFAAVAATGTTKTWLVFKDQKPIDTFGKVTDNRYISAEPNGITVDFANNIYVVGYVDDHTGTSHWLVRKSIDEGATWNVVDNYWEQDPYRYLSAVATSVTTDAKGVVYVSGYVIDNSGSRWMIRKSSDGGQTWSTVDTFRHTEFKSSTPNFAFDFKGIPVVVGVSYDGENNPHWTTRVGIDGGKQWTTQDDFQFASAKDQGAFGGGYNTRGELITVGEGHDSNNKNHWLVRKTGPCR